jgi:GNAT superfamily N-acetyltransferase
MTALKHRPAAVGEQVTAARAIIAGRFTLRINPEREEWCEVEEWMSAAGWDSGYGDAAAVQNLDPRCLVIGMLDDRPVAGVSLLRVSREFAFAGSLIVRPEVRELGFGRALWNISLPHAGSRVIGIEAPHEMAKACREAGFTEAYDTIGYQGRAAARPRPVDAGVRGIEPRDRSAVTGLDALCSPFARREVLTAWLAADAARTLVYEQGDQVTGFGVIRPCRTGYRIGPLIACDEHAALALFDALAALCPGELINMSAPEPNRAATDLARARDLAEQIRTTRMYSAPIRPAAVTRCYSTTSLSYG